MLTLKLCQETTLNSVLLFFDMMGRKGGQVMKSFHSLRSSSFLIERWKEIWTSSSSASSLHGFITFNRVLSSQGSKRADLPTSQKPPILHSSFLSHLLAKTTDFRQQKYLFSKHFRPFTVCNCQAQSENHHHFPHRNQPQSEKKDLPNPTDCFYQWPWPGFSFPLLQVTLGTLLCAYYLTRQIFLLPWRHKVLPWRGY